MSDDWSSSSDDDDTGMPDWGYVLIGVLVFLMVIAGARAAVKRQELEELLEEANDLERRVGPPRASEEDKWKFKLEQLENRTEYIIINSDTGVRHDKDIWVKNILGALRARAANQAARDTEG